MAHASTHPAHPLPPVAPRRLLLAQRLLRGEGSVEVTAFRAGETLMTAVHGVSADGRLVVAHVPNLLGSLGAFHTPAPLDVRVDVLRDALDLTLPTCQGPLSSAHRRPVFLPAGGHQNCPLVASWFARLGGGAGHRDGISSVA